MATLSIQERKRLRQIGHALNPVVMLGGSGLTENVVEEILRALNDHELIKVKIAGEDREERAAIIAEIASTTGAEIVQTIGKMSNPEQIETLKRCRFANFRVEDHW